MTTAKKETKAIAKVQLSDDEMALLNSDSSKELNELSGLFKHFKEKESSELKQLTSEYLEMKENSKYDFIFTGMTTFTTSDNEVREAAMLYDESGKQFINGGAVLVAACKRIQKTPAFIRIETRGKKASGTGNGKYLEMDICTI